MGYPQFQATNESKALTLQQGEISALQSEARRLEGLIEALTRDRSAILRKINHTQATTSHLPVEVLSSIFKFARPPIDFSTRYVDFRLGDNVYHAEENFHHTLAAVCYSWHQIVLSTSQLWTTITLRVDRRSLIKNLTSLLGLYFERARGFPISIELDFNGEAVTWGVDSMKPIQAYEEYLSLIEPLKTALFVDGADKIRHLVLIRPPTEWLLLLNEKLTQCTTATIFYPMKQYSDVDENDFFNLVTMPCLQRVELVALRDLPSIPNTVTTLHLRDMAFSDCYHSLVSYTNLVDFEMIGYSGFELLLPDGRISEPIVFPQLEHFRWNRFSSFHRDIEDFLRYARFPKLRSLHWFENSDIHYPNLPTGSQRDPRPILDFFSNLPPTLSSLTIFQASPSFKDDTDVDATFIERLLDCVPQVTKLHFSRCSKAMIEYLVDAIGKPHSPPDSPRQYQYQKVDANIDGISGNKVLPNLRELVIDNARDRAWYNIDNLWQKIDNMLKALRVTSGCRETFHLVIDSTVDEYDDQETLQKAKVAAMANGFNLKISFNSCGS